MATDQTKVCTIINNTSSDIIIASATSGNETTVSGALKSANGRLEMFLTDSSGIVIKAGSSGSITLDRIYSGGGYVPTYDLQVCSSNWLYPIARLTVTQSASNGTTGFAPQTVTADSGTGMAQAFTFYQTISVYPNSLLTRDYVVALQQTQMTDSGALTSFFENTISFKKVTLADMVAVESYYNNFPYVWALYSACNYYLYSQGATAPVFAGTVTLRNEGIADVTRTDCGYTCLFTPAIPATDGSVQVDPAKAVTLHYNDGVFNDDHATIMLKGNFMLERTFTRIPDDVNVVAVLTGTLNGVLATGYYKSQTGAVLAQPSATAAASVSDTYADPVNILKPAMAS